MKKFYLFLSAASVVASASAFDKEMAIAPARISETPTLSLKAAPFATASKAKKVESLEKGAAKTRAGEFEYTYYRPAPEIMAIGLTPSGFNLDGRNYGFASSYGNIEFDSYCVGAKSYEWQYSENNDMDEEYAWNISTSDKEDLVFKSGVGGFMTPMLSTVYDSGATGFYSMDYIDEYITGGGPEMMFGPDPDGGYVGATFYQNMLLRSPEGYAADLNVMNVYAPGVGNFSKKGVFPQWTTKLSNALGETVTDMEFQNFLFIQPKPASTYMMSKAWIWVGLDAAKETQLISYIYPIDDDGMIADDPIALGYAAVSKGESHMLVFEYNPLDEEGDELEGDLFINSAVAITVEGFSGNDAIKIFYPQTGYYPFEYEATETWGRSIIKPATTYVTFGVQVGGEWGSVVACDTDLYYFDQSVDALGNIINPDVVTCLSYCQLFIDAVYPYIYTVGGEESAKIALEGGNADVDIVALYYNMNAMIGAGYYEVEAPEWLTVSFGESDMQTGVTKMTLTASASETDRTGYVNITGWDGQAQLLNLKVDQGEGSGVASISIDKNAQYFDLQGRPVANPDKGIYIKKAGNKSEKVIF